MQRDDEIAPEGEGGLAAANDVANRIGRRLAWPVVVVAAVAMLLLAGLAIHDMNDLSSGTISNEQYRTIRVGDTRTQIQGQLGRPRECDSHQPCGVAVFPAPPPGATCDFYAESDAIMDPGVVRLCFMDAHLVEKASYDMEGGAQQVCLWGDGATAPICTGRPGTS